jgi:hypothetical protein
MWDGDFESRDVELETVNYITNDTHIVAAIAEILYDF